MYFILLGVKKSIKADYFISEWLKQFCLNDD